MERTILLYILGLLAKKPDGSPDLYADADLAQDILAFIREEDLVGVIEQAGMREDQVPAYLHVRLANLNGLHCADCRYFFRHRAVLARLHQLVRFCRSHPTQDPAEQQRRERRIRELGSQLGSDPASRSHVGEALYYAAQ